MKKTVFFLAAAATLAACSKTEVTPVISDENSEITFNVAPRTKADQSTSSADFGHANIFSSYAYFLTDGKKWPENAGVSYIDAAEISYDGDKTNADDHTGKWHAATTYYWPKSEASSLTFFAWSKNSDNLTLTGAEVECGAKDGIKFTNYDVTKNLNVDLLVADVAANQQKNQEKYLHVGVPTLFRHKLSYVIFTVKTDKEYVNKKFQLNSIKFTKINTTGEYNQTASATDGKSESWTVSDAEAEQVYTKVATDITNTVTNLDANAYQKYYLPQTFQTFAEGQTFGASDSDVIEIVYTITTTENGSVSTETVTKYVSAKEAFKGDWLINKRYTCNLIFSLDEILWDPAVEIWEDVTGGDITL